jgi:hypothetical protein
MWAGSLGCHLGAFTHLAGAVLSQQCCVQFGFRDRWELIGHKQLRLCMCALHKQKSVFDGWKTG